MKERLESPYAIRLNKLLCDNVLTRATGMTEFQYQDWLENEIENIMWDFEKIHDENKKHYLSLYKSKKAPFKNGGCACVQPSKPQQNIITRLSPSRESFINKFDS